MAIDNGITPTQQRLLKVLSDGESHSYTELLKQLDDDMAGLQVLHVHISNLRKRLPEGEEIICQLAGYARGFRHIRVLVNGK